MTYEEAKAKVEELRERFDEPFSPTDKATIETLYFEVTRKRFVPTTCQQCYHDALIEIYLKLKKEKAMPKQCNYVMKAGFIISCPDFYHGKIFTNENLTDKVAKEYLDRFPHMEGYFQQMPEEELIENKEQPADATADKQPTGGSDETAGKKPTANTKGGDKKEDTEPTEKAGKEE